MALINGLYIFVESENQKGSIESTTHPTEKGLPLTSTVQKQPITISLQGRIVETDNYSVADTIKQIEKLMNSGSLVKYVGNLMIVVGIEVWLLLFLKNRLEGR